MIRKSYEINSKLFYSIIYSILEISFENKDLEPVYTHFGAQEGADVCPAGNQRVLTTLHGIYAR